MNWAQGYTSEYYATRIDPATWRDIERIEITGGTIKRESEGLRDSAQIYCDKYPQGIEQWIRIYMDSEQGGSNEHVALFTGLATTPQKDMNGVIETSAIECYSVLKPAADIYLLRGWYAPAGASGATVIRDLLNTLPAPVEIADNAPTLSSAIISEQNETRLTMIEKILTAIDWRLRVRGDGRIFVEPKSDEPVATFDPLEFDVLETEIKVKADYFSAPNVFMAIDNDLTAIARDDSLDSPLSTVNRGREVWATDTAANLAENQTIEQYARMRLDEAQKVQKIVSYNRRFMPDIVPGDVVRLRYPEQDVNGLFRVNTQSIDIGYSATTNEEITAL